MAETERQHPKYLGGTPRLVRTVKEAHDTATVLDPTLLLAVRRNTLFGPTFHRSPPQFCTSPDTCWGKVAPSLQLAWRILFIAFTSDCQILSCTAGGYSWNAGFTFATVSCRSPPHLIVGPIFCNNLKKQGSRCPRMASSKDVSQTWRGSHLIEFKVDVLLDLILEEDLCSVQLHSRRRFSPFNDGIELSGARFRLSCSVTLLQELLLEQNRLFRGLDSWILVAWRTLLLITRFPPNHRTRSHQVDSGAFLPSFYFGSSLACVLGIWGAFPKFCHALSPNYDASGPICWKHGAAYENLVIWWCNNEIVLLSKNIVIVPGSHHRGINRMRGQNHWFQWTVHGGTRTVSLHTGWNKVISDNKGLL